MSNIKFQLNIERRPHTTGGCLIQV